MKRVLTALAALAAVWGMAPASASALSITHTFCVADSDPVGESASCTTGLGATLEITDIDEAERIYEVILTLDTSDPSFDTATHTSIEGVQFAIDGYGGGPAPNFGDYEGVPTVDTSGVDGGGTWNVFFFSIPNCDSNTGGPNVCASGSTDTGDVDVWSFTINLDNTVDPITEAVDLNLRAVSNNNVLLSPNFQNVPDDGGTPGTGGPGGGVGPGGVVPEPASLLLLGSGLAVAASRFRRRRQQP